MVIEPGAVTTELEGTFRRSPRVLSRWVAGDVLVTTSDDPNIHVLTGGAASIWDHLNAPGTSAEILGRLAKTHAVPERDIADEVRACFAELFAIGAIERADGDDD